MGERRRAGVTRPPADALTHPLTGPALSPHKFPVRRGGPGWDHGSVHTRQDPIPSIKSFTDILNQ